MNKRILRTKQDEIVKTGRLVFEGLFGDGQAFQSKIERELDTEAERHEMATIDDSAGRVIDVPGHSLVRCIGCGREQTIAPTADALALESVGWRFHAPSTSWKCPFCARR